MDFGLQQMGGRKQGEFLSLVIDIYLTQGPMEIEIVRAVRYEVPLVTCWLGASRTTGNGLNPGHWFHYL